MKLLPLPIDPILPDILDKLRAAGAVVVTAEPGAGKTTRIPPAILDRGLATLSDGSLGQIVVLQPRRVAAYAAAARMSEERGSALGAEIGYQVRHERRASARTRILVCTEGVFLRRLQDDPFLENIAAVVFDEFHERNLNSDLALAMVRQVRESARPDLRVVIMSATLDAGLVSRYLNECPAVEVKGKNFAVDIEYLPFPAKVPVPQLVAEGVERILDRTSGHVLAFLPGVGEIRKVEALLEHLASDRDLSLMPLYGEMPLNDQQRVLHPSSKRKIVLATNVAETSLTIDGVTAVVDSGVARARRFDPQHGLNRLNLERISQASARQRSGRAGRTAPGICVRLWTEREQLMLPEYHTPEIARIELSEPLLQLVAWGESDVRSFPWLEPPPIASVDHALELLEVLGSLHGGLLTELGRRMAGLPLPPRLARLLLEGQKSGQLERASMCAALLAERDPFRRDREDRQALHHTTSDVLDRLAAIEEFATVKQRTSAFGEILNAPATNIIRASEQYRQLLGDAQPASGKKSGKPDSKPAVHNDDEPLLRGLLVTFPDRVCRRRAPNSRRAVMVGGRGVRLADESGVLEGEFFVAVEFVESRQESELIVRQASFVDRGWLDASCITTTVDAAYDSNLEKVSAVKRTRFCDLVIDEMPTALPSDIDPGQFLAQAVSSRIDVKSLVDEDAMRYLARLQCLRVWLPELELPDVGTDPWQELLPEWCSGCSSLAELRSKSLVPALQRRLTYEQILTLDREAPDRIRVPSGRDLKIKYEAGKPPVLSVRIQELFGMSESPRIASSRVPVLLELLAPNYRIQQITPDLASFWKNTYPDVRKELKRRYPKHSWPDDPLKAQAESRPQRR